MATTETKSPKANPKLATVGMVYLWCFLWLSESFLIMSDVKWETLK